MATKLILFSGPACSGKSTLAARLAAETGAPHLEMDRVRQRVLPGASHTRADRIVALQVMLFVAERLLNHGIGVILDAQYRREVDREPVYELAGRTGCRLALIECAVSPAEAVRRFHRRGPDPVRLDLTARRVERMARDFPYSREGLLLDTEAQSPAECLEQIRRYLAALDAGPGPATSPSQAPPGSRRLSPPLRLRSGQRGGETDRLGLHHGPDSDKLPR